MLLPPKLGTDRSSRQCRVERKFPKCPSQLEPLSRRLPHVDTAYGSSHVSGSRCHLAPFLVNPQLTSSFGRRAASSLLRIRGSLSTRALRALLQAIRVLGTLWGDQGIGLNQTREEATLSTSARLNQAIPLNWLQLAILLGLLAFVYYGILGALVLDWWNDPNFSHGFFVPLFSFFVIWQDRSQLARLPLKPHWFGLVVITGALLILVVGVLGAELFLSRSSFVFLLAGLIIYFSGWQYFRALLFPWAVLFLMIPIPVVIFNEVTFPLQFMASRLATFLLSLVGVPVLREGNVIHLSSMSLEV